MGPFFFFFFGAEVHQERLRYWFLCVRSGMSLAMSDESWLSACRKLVGMKFCWKRIRLTWIEDRPCQAENQYSPYTWEDAVLYSQTAEET